MKKIHYFCFRQSKIRFVITEKNFPPNYLFQKLYHVFDRLYRAKMKVGLTGKTQYFENILTQL